MAIEFEPFSNDWKSDPYPKYRELRDEAPVHWAPESQVWCISRHEDVQDVLMRPEVFGSARTFQQRQMEGGLGKLRLLANGARFLWGMRVPPWSMWRQRMLIMEDGETHQTMRKLVNRGFTPRQIEAWEVRIREIVVGCMARIDTQKHFDVVHDLAIPVPVTVIAEMLGIEPERREEFKHWSDVIIAASTGSGMGGGLRGEMLDVMIAMKRYLGPIVKRRRADPRDDLVSILAERREGDANLSDHEIFMFFLLLLIAGNETTTNLLGNAVDALLEHPDELARVAADASLIPGLIEETLRFDSPVQSINRVVTRDVELRGQTIREGQAVMVMLAAANRDERHFPDPDRFDPGRDTRGHVAFGFGAHFCLGASLARLEARCALEGIVPRLPGLVRVRPEREFLDSYVIRGRSRIELRAAA